MAGTASGSIMVSSGTLNGGDTMTYNISSPVDMSAIGSYSINAYLTYTPDMFPTNDTLAEFSAGVENMTVEAADMALYLGQPAEINASHPLLKAPLAFTELWQFTTAYSSSITWPAHLSGAPTNRDYIELVNFGGGVANLEGWQFERVGTSAHSYTFPAGASVPSGEPCVLITGTGTDDPANNVFYIGGTADAVFSSSGVGYILRAADGSVVDAVGTNGYTFTNDVTGSDWSGSIPSSSSQMGVYLNGADDNTATNWVVTSNGYQNTANMGVANGSSNASDPVVDWTLNGMMITDSATTLVNTPASAGMWTYAAAFTDAGGCMYSDSVTVTVQADSCLPPANVQLLQATDSSLTITWDTVPGAVSYKIVLRDRTGSTNVIKFKHQQDGFLTIDGLPAANRYFVQIRAQCGSGFYSLSDRLIVTTLPGTCDDVTTYSTAPVGGVRARINWVSPATAAKIWIRWKPLGAMNWTDTIVKDTSRNRHWLTGLANNTNYRWEIKAPCTVSGLGSNWSPTQSFTTAPSNKWDLIGSGTESGAGNILVFPNPNNGQFRLDIEVPTAGERTLEVVNAMGQLVWLETLRLAEGGNSHAVDLGSLAKGIYFLRITGDAERSIQRIVIE